MKKCCLTLCILLSIVVLLNTAFKSNSLNYRNHYNSALLRFKTAQQHLISAVENNSGETNIYQKLKESRKKLKAVDFWLRYLQPVAYKKINGPLPVEWETEVFEKFEKPYMRPGAGLTLAENYMGEPNGNKDTLIDLLKQSDAAIKVFEADSTTAALSKPDHFFFANRLFLLNLSAIYTNGFECPNTDNIVDELESMVMDVKDIYSDFNSSFPSFTISPEYNDLYNKMIDFVKKQNRNPERFDHYHFIKDFVNPLYSLNQHFIRTNKIYSRSFVDYSLNNDNKSIFDKDLYNGQNRKGIYIAVDDEATLGEIREVGKMLFYDPILSGDGKRSCASCHKPEQYFNDTTGFTSMAFNQMGTLARNTPSLVNVVYNHLLMLDGKHISLQNQATDVMTNANEMGCDPKKIVENVLSCSNYKKAFQKFKKLMPLYPQISAEHIVSAITLFYSSFSDFNAPFDRAMNNKEVLSAGAIQGFNLFMSKAQCGTCHFVPQFNGVKPPYVGSEFEVLGVPENVDYKKLSADVGRYSINASKETMHAFRTGSIRNSSFTAPYMHNGIFKTVDEVIEFYNVGGGAGKGLEVANQTLSADSLHLTTKEKNALKAFIITLNENIIFPLKPTELPTTNMAMYKNRKVGGEY